MRRSILLLAVPLTLLARTPDGVRASLAPAPPARVEVLEGRAVLAVADGLVRMTPQSPPQALSGPVHLEVMPDSRVRVHWNGYASVLLEGRAALEWRGARTRESDFDWVLEQVERAHVEIRRGQARLALPGGWSARLESSAFSLRGRPDGETVLHHDAGLPLTLWPPAQGARAEAPYVVQAGAHLRLLAGVGRPLATALSAGALGGPADRLGFERRSARAPVELRAAVLGNAFQWPWLAAGAPSAPAARAEAEPVTRSDPEPATTARAASEPAFDVDPWYGSRQPDETPDAPGPEAPRRAEDESVDPAAAGPGAGGLERPERDERRDRLAPPQPPGPSGTGSDPSTGSVGVPPGEPPAGSRGQPEAEEAGTRSGVRRTGVLLMTPYGPRWVDRPPPPHAQGP